MSHFLTRLVQRTRGELSTVRPVLAAVTAPDPTAAAWDEQVMVREADPLLAAPQVPRGAAPRPASADIPFAEPREEQIATGELPRAVPARSPVPADPTRGSPLAESRDEPAAIREAVVAAARSAAPAVDSLAPAASPGAPAALPAPPAAPPGGLPGTPAALRVPPAALREAPDPMPILASAEPARDAPASRVSPSATAPASAAETGPAADPIAARRSSANAIARQPSAATLPARDPHAMVADPEPRPAAHEATAIASIPPATLGRSPRRVGPPSGSFSPPVHANAAPPPPASRRGLAAHAASPGLVHETTTTVEVSIGRIEVRLPPRPQASAGAASPSTRRPVIGLAEYLRSRDTGKTP